MTIKALLSEPEFERVVYYLSECGRTNVRDLSGFNYDELTFVPGVSEETIEKVRILVEKALAETANGICDEVHLAEEQSMSLISHNEADNTLEKKGGFGESLELLKKALVIAEDTRMMFKIRHLLSTVIIDDKEELIELCDILSNHVDNQISEIEPQKELHLSEQEEAILSNIKIERVFATLPRGGLLVHHLHEIGIHTMLDMEGVDILALNVKNVGRASLVGFKKEYYEKRGIYLASSGDTNTESPVVVVQNGIHKLGERALGLLRMRAAGLTLQNVGDQYGITRERVRQITGKSVRILRGACVALFSYLTSTQGWIYSSEIKEKLNGIEELDIILFVFQNIDTISYLPFADKYVLTELLPREIDERLIEIAREKIGDSADYYEKLELIDEALESAELYCINSIDFLGYILEHGYKAFGDYVVKKNQAYKNLCLNVIERFFPEGIKLDADEQNKDMFYLRRLVAEEFGSVRLPDSNRALTARLTTLLILSGRGKYCLPQSIDVSIGLLNEIVEYIQSSKESTIYYNELFSAFRGRLLAETSIDNANFLHGVLKYYYPKEYVYERDLLVKKGMERISYADRVSSLLRESQCAVNREIIKAKIPGITDIVISMAVANSDEMIQWDENNFIHVCNLRVDEEDLQDFENVIREKASKYKGYCCGRSLYKIVIEKNPSFIEKNAISSWRNLFYMAAHFFAKSFRFSCPHIATELFPPLELTNASVVNYFFFSKKKLSYSEFTITAKELDWSTGTFVYVMNEVEKRYCRISREEYIAAEDFDINENVLELLKSRICELVSTSGFYGLFSFFNYSTFPKIQYEWNEFLLQTLIERYQIGFKILEPALKDRRYKRGIIVPELCKSETYADFVVDMMIRDSALSLSTEECASYLRGKGLIINNVIPQELYEREDISISNNMVHVLLK